MLINKVDKSFQSRSDMPNANWLGEEWYLVADDSVLAEKIQALYPRFDFVTDTKGSLIDVKEIKKTKKEINQEKIQEVDNELMDIDKKGLNRYIEDIIEKTGIYMLMVDGTKELIERKKELRKEREKLKT